MINFGKRVVLHGSILAAALIAPAISLATEIEYVSNENIATMGPYSPATAFGDLVFTSGQIALDAKEGKIVGTDVREQTRKALENLRAVLEASGSSLEHVLKVTVYLQNPEDFGPMNEVYAEFFPKNKPARSTVPGVSWGGTVLVEIEAIAVRIKESTD